MFIGHPLAQFTRMIHGLAALVLLVGLFVSSRSAAAFDYYDLAGHWSPVVFQDTATKDSNISQDFVTNFNFDGDYNAYNNWENQPNYPNSAYLYYSVVETQTHYYLIYTLFHPRDWEQICTGIFGECHENDGEQVRLVVSKSGGAYGTLQVMETQAHGSVDAATPPGSPVTGGSKNVDAGDVTFEGSHPRVFVEAHGHGPYPCDSRCDGFPGGDGVVYRFKGFSEVPSSEDDPDVAYDVIDEYYDLWQRRNDAGPGNPFKSTTQYVGVRLGSWGEPIGKDFGGDTYGNGGHPGWGWGGKDGVNMGDWLIDAAYVAKLWYTIPNENDPGFLSYTYDRYKDDLEAEGPGGGGGGGGGGGCTMVAGPTSPAGFLFFLMLPAFALVRRRSR